jgi:hypothetical protein
MPVPVPALLLVLVLLTSCQNRGRGESEDELARKLCAAACASISTGCPDPEPVALRQKRCVALCSSTRKEAERAGCGEAQDGALGCVSTAQISCQAMNSVRSALERGSGVVGCLAAFERLAGCAAPCREPGVTRTATRELPWQGARVEVKAEQIGSDCGPVQPQLPAQAPPGSRCEHHSVCSRVRCPCPGRNGSYVARACVDGRCGGAEAACALVPLAVGYDACQAR